MAGHPAKTRTGSVGEDRLSSLPMDCALELGSYLDVSDVSTMRRVSKSWKPIAETLLNGHELRIQQGRPTRVIRCPNATHLWDLKGDTAVYEDFTDRKVRIVDLTGKWEMVQVDYVKAVVDAHSEFADHTPHLRMLKLTDNGDIVGIIRFKHPDFYDFMVNSNDPPPPDVTFDISPGADGMGWGSSTRSPTQSESERGAIPHLDRFFSAYVLFRVTADGKLAWCRHDDELKPQFHASLQVVDFDGAALNWGKLYLVGAVEKRFMKDIIVVDLDTGEWTPLSSGRSMEEQIAPYKSGYRDSQRRPTKVHLSPDGKWLILTTLKSASLLIVSTEVEGLVYSFEICLEQLMKDMLSQNAHRDWNHIFGRFTVEFGDDGRFSISHVFLPQEAFVFDNGAKDVEKMLPYLVCIHTYSLGDNSAVPPQFMGKVVLGLGTGAKNFPTYAARHKLLISMAHHRLYFQRAEMPVLPSFDTAHLDPVDFGNHRVDAKLGPRFAVKDASNPEDVGSNKQLQLGWEGEYEYGRTNRTVESFRGSYLVVAGKTPVEGEDENSDSDGWMDQYQQQHDTFVFDPFELVFLGF